MQMMEFYSSLLMNSFSNSHKRVIMWQYIDVTNTNVEERGHTSRKREQSSEF